MTENSGEEASKQVIAVNRQCDVGALYFEDCQSYTGKSEK